MSMERDDIKGVLQELTTSEITDLIVELLDRSHSQGLPVIIAIPTVEGGKITKLFSIMPQHQEETANLLADIIEAQCQRNPRFGPLLTSSLMHRRVNHEKG